MKIEKVEVHTDFIKLDQFIKFSGFCVTGAEAKNLITEGYVYVNDVLCLMRGKKLVQEDIITIKIEKKTYTFQVCKPTQEDE